MDQKAKLKIAEIAIKKSKDEIAEGDAIALREAAARSKQYEAKIVKLEKELEKSRSVNQNLSEKLKDANLQLKESILLAKRSRARCEKALDQGEEDNMQPNISQITRYKSLCGWVNV